MDSSEDLESVLQISELMFESAVDDPVGAEILYEDFSNLDENPFTGGGMEPVFLFVDDQQ